MRNHLLTRQDGLGLRFRFHGRFFDVVNGGGTEPVNLLSRHRINNPTSDVPLTISHRLEPRSERICWTFSSQSCTGTPLKA